MGFIAKVLDGIAKAVPILVQRIATTLMIIFFLGVLFGLYIVATKGLLALVGLAIVIVIMYYKLDEGFLALLIYLFLMFFF